MIEALAANRTDHALDVGPMPRGARRTKHLLHAHVVDLSGEVVAKGSIPISQQIAWRRVPGERIAKLLGGPFRSRMSRDVEVQYPPPLMGEHQEYVQNLEADGWHGEEVDRDKLLDVVVEKCPPGLAGRLSLPDHILADASLADVNTELE